MKYIILFLLIPFLGTSQELESHMMRVEVVNQDTFIVNTGFEQNPETIEIKGQTFVALTKQVIPAREVNTYYLLEKKRVYIQKGLLIPKL